MLQMKLTLDPFRQLPIRIVYRRDGFLELDETVVEFTKNTCHLLRNLLRFEEMLFQLFKYVS